MKRCWRSCCIAASRAPAHSRCIAGFGAHQQMHTPKIEALSEHLPIRIEFIETPERVDALLPALYDMVTDGLIEVQDTTIVKIARKDRPGPAPARIQQRGVAKMLRVFLGEADQSEGEPLYEAIVKRLRMLEIAGATVYRGILGYGAKGHTHRSGFFAYFERPAGDDLGDRFSGKDRRSDRRDRSDARRWTDRTFRRGLCSDRTCRGNGRCRRLGPLDWCGFCFPKRTSSTENPRMRLSSKSAGELGIAGAMVLRGVEGFGESAEMHRAHLLVSDRPIVVTIVDSEENVERACSRHWRICWRRA